MIPSLAIHRSNRLEPLAERLCDLVSTPLPNPLQAETIIVQSLGMRRWLSLTLATRLGISMNCRFPFPHTLAHAVFRSAFPNIPESSEFSREILPWRIYSLLPELAARPEFVPLRRYVGTGEMSGLKRFQLARQLAALYDRLLVHRAGDLLRWEQGEATGWEAALWKELAAGRRGEHPPALLERLLARLEAGRTELPGIPPRLSVFGISSLPPFYLDLLNAVSQCVELHLFLFEPTDQYWGDIQGPREQRRFLRRHAKPEQTAAELHLSTGNALLASLGKQGRQFADAVHDLEPNVFDEVFQPPERNTLLSRLQSDFFEVLDRPFGEKETIGDADRSIQIHCCHGPMREVEILHDHLLGFFNAMPALTPKDIVVMMPDVETYAPFIEAVFDSPEEESLRIPFTIADRRAAAENASAQCFLEILALQGSRFGAATVFQLLERGPVRKRFGLAEADLETIRGWVEKMKIRWGIDAEHRNEFDVPAFGQNSWRTGLDRLLLGYALAGDGSQMFEDILPAEGIEGGLAEVLGKFADFTGKLFDLVPGLDAARTLGKWEDALDHLATSFLDETEESSNDLRRVRAALEALGEFSKFHREPVPFDVIKAHLGQAFSDTDSGRGFLVGHVTFCSLKPMRSIPFSVICMLGLNDTAFPRRDPEGALDLLAGAGQPGRSRRDEDRQVFLEALLSARDVIYLSYSGLSVKDNSESPPSVIVSEVLDYLAGNYERPSKPPLADWVQLKHRLQPFSKSYFSSADERFFSFSRENARAARRPERQAEPPSSLIDGLLPEPGPEWLAMELATFQRFFRHPVRFFLSRRASLRLPEDEMLLTETEPLVLDGRDQWQMQNTLAARLIGGGELAPNLRAIRAEGTLPFGYPGNGLLHDVCTTIDPLVSRMRAAAGGAGLPPETVVLEIGRWSLSGTLTGRIRAGLIRLTAWKLSSMERMAAWLDHLVLCAAHPGEDGLSTRLFATNFTLEIARVPNPREVLEDLLSIYWDGLRAPIPYFPKSSYEFARRTFRPAPKETSVENPARDIWEDLESSEPHHELCFRGRDPLDDAWRELALRVWEPFFNHSAEVKIEP